MREASSRMPQNRFLTLLLFIQNLALTNRARLAELCNVFGGKAEVLEDVVGVLFICRSV